MEDIFDLRAQLGRGFRLIAVVSTVLMIRMIRGSLEFIKYTKFVRNLVDR